MIALVGGDGWRRVVWGIGATLEEAEADLPEDAPKRYPFEEYEISEAQAEIVRRGDVSWPVAIPEETDESRDCLSLAVHGRTRDNE